MKTKRLFQYLVLMLAAASAVSCTNDGKYVNYEGTVAYSHWTFSFGTINDKLPEVDPATFQSINNWLGHDAKHCYFKNILIKDADVSTFEACKYPLCRDRKDYYYKGIAMNVDPVTFKVLKQYEDDLWGIDSRYAYYDTTRIEADVATFKVKDWCVAVDKNNVYRYGKILPLADPETYQESWEGYYSRDKAHIWYMGDLVEDADYATFKVDKQNPSSASDKNGVFERGKRPTEEPDSAEVADADTTVVSE